MKKKLKLVKTYIYILNNLIFMYKTKELNKMSFQKIFFKKLLI